MRVALQKSYSSLFVVAAASAAVLGLAAHAETPKAPAAAPAPSVEIDLVSKRVLEAAVGKTFDSGQINMLHSVAHQHVVTLVCRGFAVDPSRFEREMNLIYYDDKGQQKTLSSEELHEVEKQAMVGFGLVLGAQISIATLNTEAFCKNATEEKASADLPHLIWAK